jgi:hypothetical protein
MTEGEQVVEDYVSMRLTLRRHPLALLRHILTPDADRTAQPYVSGTKPYKPPMPLPFTRANPD